MFMQMVSRFLISCVLALGAMPTWAEPPVHIGAVLAISGPASVYGLPADRALWTLLDGMAKDGLAGRQVKVTIYDSEGNSTKAVQLFRRLVDSDQVQIVFGPSTSGESMAVVPVANQLKVPNITFGAAGSITDPVTPYVFATSPTDRLVVENILDHARQRGLKRLAVLYSQDTFGQSGGNFVKDLAAQFGAELVAVETFAAQDMSATAQLLRIKEKAPQALIVWAPNPGPTIALRNAKELGISLPTYLSYASATLSFVEQSGAVAEGVFVPAVPIIAPELLPVSDPRRSVMVKFSEQYRLKWKSAPDLGAGHALDAKLIVENAVKTISGEVTRENLRQAIEKVQMCGANGCRKLAPNDHRGLDRDALVMLRVKDGKWVLGAP
jgi:ABC-type branched-chain amino acid transport systems, periplasmic component